MPHVCTFDAHDYAIDQVVDAVHAKGSFIYLQLWAIGRQAIPRILAAEGSYPHISASGVPLKSQDTAPRPLTESGMFT
jgi:NADPH2 dehydrogenase